MRVTFVNPNFSPRRSRDAMEPLAFAILSAYTPAGTEKRFYDERVESVPIEEATDLVAISVQTYTARRAYALAAAYRARGVPVVLGGCHPTLVPEEAKGFADSVAMGDAEAVWPEIVRDAAAGRLKPIYDGRAASESSPIGPFDRSIFKGKPYPVLKPVQYGRGCRFSCDFCSVRAIHGGSLRKRDLGEFAAELESIASHFIFFSDDNLFADRAVSGALLSRIKPLKKRFACQMSVDAAADVPFLDELAASGCLAVFLGFESMDGDNLKAMRKSANAAEKYPGVVSAFRERGIMVMGSFVFGYDSDDEASVEGALAFAEREKLCLAHFNLLYPFPGTPLIERVRAEGRMRYGDWWLSPEYEYGACMISPKRIGADALEEACWKARSEFNSIRSMLARAADPGANARDPARALLFWLSNLSSRGELRKKRGMRLG